MPDLFFNGMSFMFALRDLVQPRARILRDVDLRPGHRVLDYGCGPGAYVTEAARRVGPTGRVYALDIHPLAVERVRLLARRRGLENVEAIRSGCDTGLSDDSVDVVLLYDIFHMLSEPEAVLAELHRVLVPGGTLSVLDPHMGEADLVRRIMGSGLFALVRKGRMTHGFEALHPTGTPGR
jgi:ubiquinone/menaquinone biosynthesis C-methylase UbiE